MDNEYNLDVPRGLRKTKVEETKISSCDSDKGLNYYGYPIEYLAFACEFEEVMYLLQYGVLPKSEELTCYKKNLLKYFNISDTLKTYMKNLPENASIKNVIRAVINYLSIYDPEKEDYSNNKQIVIKTVATVAASITYWKNLKEGISIVDEIKTNSFASEFLYHLKGTIPSKNEIKAFNTLLILYAEHELNASTYTGIVSASTNTDYYSAILSAFGAFIGPIHGGACEIIMRQLEEFLNNDILEIVEKKLNNHEKIYGFGHGAYGPSGDPRSPLMKHLTKILTSEDYTYKKIELLENIMKEKLPNLPTNVDLYAAIVMRYFGISPEYATIVIFMSRLNGISAHINEKREEGTLIRPRAFYIGNSKCLADISNELLNRFQNGLLNETEYKLIKNILKDKYQKISNI